MNARSAKTWLSPAHSSGLVARHARVVEAARAALGGAGANAFLNHHHAGLHGRPLDLAVASDAGLEAVETALCVEARRGIESS
jgi:uncharacterized protein (DUF2384 family)